MIDHDVPIPTNTRSQHPILPRAVLAAMQVGDSVRIVGNSREIQNARNAASVYGKIAGWKFTARTEDNGIRIWRTA